MEQRERGEEIPHRSSEWTTESIEVSVSNASTSANVSTRTCHVSCGHSRVSGLTRVNLGEGEHAHRRHDGTYELRASHPAEGIQREHRGYAACASGTIALFMPQPILLEYAGCEESHGSRHAPLGSLGGSGVSHRWEWCQP